MAAVKQARLFDGELDEYPLYGGEPPHERVDTSWQAAKSIEDDAETMRGKVLACLIFLGRRAAQAAGHHVERYCTWSDYRSGRAAVLPHPSGVNRWYNQIKHRRMAERFLRRTWLRFVAVPRERWVASYKACGYTAEVQRRRDVRLYCPCHGSDLHELYKVPTECELRILEEAAR